MAGGSGVGEDSVDVLGEDGGIASKRGGNIAEVAARADDVASVDVAGGEGVNGSHEHDSATAGDEGGTNADADDTAAPGCACVRDVMAAKVDPAPDLSRTSDRGCAQRQVVAARTLSMQERVRSGEAHVAARLGVTAGQARHLVSARRRPMLVRIAAPRPKCET